MTAESAPSIVDIIKNTTYGVAFLFSADFLGFDAQAGLVLGILMVVDVVTGIIRSAIVNGGPTVTSSIGTRGLLKKVLTISGLISFALAFKGIGFAPEIPISGIVSVFILAELYSIIGNVHSALTKQTKSEYDAVKYLIEFVGGALERMTKIK